MEIIELNGERVEVEEETAELYKHVKSYTDASILFMYDTADVVEVFNLNYMRDLKDYYSSGIISRSNWTQHTASTFLKTCQQIDFLCEFEAINRHDGVIRFKDGKVLLCAEWEIDEKTTFGENGEVNKLLGTCKNHHCDAMLLTYNVGLDLKTYVRDIYDMWSRGHSKNDNFRLFLIVALFDESDKKRVKLFRGLRTLTIGKNNVDIWSDLT